MSEAVGGPTDPAGDTADAVRAAREALDAARESMAALVTVRARAVREGERLRERSAVEGLAALGDDAGLQERRAAALEPRIEQLRDLARRAEVAYEALRSGSDGSSPDSGTPDDGDASSGTRGGPTDDDVRDA